MCGGVTIEFLSLTRCAAPHATSVFVLKLEKFCATQFTLHKQI